MIWYSWTFSSFSLLKEYYRKIYHVNQPAYLQISMAGQPMSGHLASIQDWMENVQGVLSSQSQFSPYLAQVCDFDLCGAVV